MSFILAAAGLAVAVTPSAEPSAEAQRQVEEADTAFWAAFNACDPKRMAELFTPDVEFYHDKTGATIGNAAVVRSMMVGPCGTPGLHVRREAVAGSLSYDPVPGFGAILTGRHRFVSRRDNEAEHLDGEARFAVVWQMNSGTMRMRRVLSFAHGPAIEMPAAEQVSVPIDTLKSYVGRYSSKMGDIVVTLTRGQLHLQSGGLSTDLVPLGSQAFQARGRSVRFEFSFDSSGRKLLVKEGGATVAEGRLANSRN
jgi:hypothetical protein